MLRVGCHGHYRSAVCTTTRNHFSSPRQSLSSVSGDNDNSNDTNKDNPTNHRKSSSSPPFRWLNLEGAGLSMLERLSLEEYLLKHTHDNWILVGRHSVWPPKHLSVPSQTNDPASFAATANDETKKKQNPRNDARLKMLPDYITNPSSQSGGGRGGGDGRGPNPNGMIVMGIGGKAEKLLNSQEVQTDKMLVVKRFSGGGTVVMDENAIWTTLIAGRRRAINEKDSDSGNANEELCKPYPRDIMEWTATTVFGPTFDQLNAQTETSQSSSADPVHAGLPKFSLREDDYVLALPLDGTNHNNENENETRKMGGNAQAITGRQGWLHHTSFLWDYDDVNMERYLKLPEKRPEYRVDRSHEDFLVKLKDHYGCGSQSQPKPQNQAEAEEDLATSRGPSFFVECMREACSESLGISETDWATVYREVFDGDDAKLQAWWLENRTRIQHDL